MSPGTGFPYTAFLSYRSDGGATADWLRERLLQYEFPEGFPIQPRKVEIFQDRSYLQPSLDFWKDEILPALRKSEFLIVVVTRRALLPDSKNEPNYLDREIRAFLSLPQGANIIVLVASGKFPGMLPDALAHRFPQLQRIDGRKCTPIIRSLYGRQSQNAIGAISAKLQKVPQDLMPALQREEAERVRKESTRRSRRLALTACILMLLAAAVLFRSWQVRSETAARAFYQANLEATEHQNLGNALAYTVRAFELSPWLDPERDVYLAKAVHLIVEAPKKIGHVGYGFSESIGPSKRVAAEFDPSGQFVLGVSADNRVSIFDFGAGKRMPVPQRASQFQSDYALAPPALSHDASKAAVVVSVGDALVQRDELWIWKVHTGEMVGWAPADGLESIDRLQFTSDDQSVIVTTWRDKQVVLDTWRIADFRRSSFVIKGATAISLARRDEQDCGGQQPLVGWSDGNKPNLLHVADMGTGRETARIEVEGRIQSICFGHDGNSASVIHATSNGGKQISLVSFAPRLEVRHFSTECDRIEDLSPDGGTLLLVSHDGGRREVWKRQAPEGGPSALTIASSDVNRIRLSAIADVVWAITASGELTVFSVSSRRQLVPTRRLGPAKSAFWHNPQRTRAVAIAPDGSLFEQPINIRLWNSDIREKARIRQVGRHVVGEYLPEQGAFLSFSAGCPNVCEGTAGRGYLMKWDRRSGAPLWPRSYKAAELRLTPNGAFAYTRIFQKWTELDLVSGGIRRFEGWGNGNILLAVRPDADHVVAYGENIENNAGILRLNIGTGRIADRGKAALPGRPEGEVLALTADGRYSVHGIGGSLGVIRYDAIEFRDWKKGSAVSEVFRFSRPEVIEFIAACLSGAPWIEVDTSRRVKFKLRNGSSFRLTIGASGPALGSVDTGHEVVVPEVSVGGKWRVSPDGRWIAALSPKNEIRVWDSRTGLQVTPELSPGLAVRAFDFDPASLRLEALLEDGEIVTWPVMFRNPPDWIHAAPGAVAGVEVTDDNQIRVGAPSTYRQQRKSWMDRVRIEANRGDAASTYVRQAALPGMH